MDVLSRLSTLLMDPDFINGLMAVTSEDELFALITKAEAESLLTKSRQKKPLLLWQGIRRHPIRSLPSQPADGIAHTYMAAESWSNMRPKRVFPSKLRPTAKAASSMPVTAEEIEGAEGIIVAADKYVPMNRFKGKRVVIVKVADGINKADALLDEALSGKVPIFEGETGGSKTAAEEAAESGARKIYKHLMDRRFPYAALCHWRGHPHRPSFLLI